MKSLSAALVIGLFVSGLCFAQTQTGNVSYNASKKGLTIAHPSMSFGTRVRITNLRNNQEVIATVDDRIPVSDLRIADISAEAGNAIGMSFRGYTAVRLEQLIPLHAAEEKPAAVLVSEETVLGPAAPVAAAPPQSAPSAPAAVVSGREEPQSESVPPQPIPVFQPQYLLAAGQNCLSPSLGLAILILLVIVALLLGAILVLLLAIHRISWRFWHYSRWVRRHNRGLRKAPHWYW
jgi:hypothetical protein